jgi:NDP-sugar pyrophosphorylase family protein
MSLEDLTVVVMAGGRGTRLAPFTLVLPKPLLPVGDRPIVEIMITRLAAFGVRRFVFSLGHMADILVAYLSALPERFAGLEIDYIREPRPLGTAGALRLLEDRLGDEFIVTNGDLLTDIDYADFIRHHKESRADLTIASFEKESRLDLGVLIADDVGRVMDYVEKPVSTHRVSMGIYMYRRTVLEHIAPDEHLDFNELVLRLVAAGKSVSAYPFKGRWLDIGRPEDYALAVEEFGAEPNRYLDAGT